MTDSETAWFQHFQNKVNEVNAIVTIDDGRVSKQQVIDNIK